MKSIFYVIFSFVCLLSQTTYAQQINPIKIAKKTNLTYLKTAESQFSNICYGCKQLNIEETVENYCKQFTNTKASETVCFIYKPKLTTILGCYSFTHDITGEIICLEKKVEPSHSEVCGSHTKSLVNQNLCLLGISKIGNEKFGLCYINTDTVEEEFECFANLLKPLYPTVDDIENEISRILKVVNSVDL